MIERYTNPEMGNIWSDQAKYQTWLDVEIAACEANCKLGKIPKAAMETIRSKASFKPERILEIEEEVRHDVIAFLTNVNEYVGDAGRYIHVGMTSSDVLDTGLALQLKSSVKLLRKELLLLEEAIRDSQATNILELGVYLGYSTIRILKNLNEVSKLTSIEANEKFAQIAREHIEISGLSKNHLLKVGKSSEIIPLLREQYDFVFIDHWKDIYLKDLKLLEEFGLLK